MEEIKRKAGRPKSTQNSIKETTNPVKEVKIDNVKTSKKREKLKLNESDTFYIKSNVFGKLIYIDHKTDDETIWENSGDVQTLTVRELRNMKAKQPIFFKENWISVVDSDDIDMNEYSTNDIYEALTVSRYYNDCYIPNELSEILEWSENEIRTNVKLMPTTIKESIIVMANDKIKDGSLDSISKVKLLEEVLDCELASPND